MGIGRNKGYLKLMKQLDIIRQGARLVGAGVVCAREIAVAGVATDEERIARFAH